MIKMTGKEMAETLSSFANSIMHDHEGFVQGVLSEHRTLQQSMFRLMIGCIFAWAKLTEEQYDLRNEQTVLTCRKIKAALEADDSFYLPYI